MPDRMLNMVSRCRQWLPGEKEAHQVHEGDDGLKPESVSSSRASHVPVPREGVHVAEGLEYHLQRGTDRVRESWPSSPPGPTSQRSGA